MDFAAIGQAAALTNPMLAASSVPILHGRTLYLDGDGLAYYCAGNDETTPAEARARCRDKVEAMLKASGAEKLLILLTGSGGHKGHRYAVARIKPYQGQRSNSNRPKNWQALRTMLELGDFGPVHIDYDREADDRFGQYGHAAPDLTVHGTQDKDMRMVPGWHIDWKDNQIFYLAPDQFAAVWKDKLYGEKWFWHQMLHGDPTDNIPGLPRAYGKLCGPVTAAKMLDEAANREQAFGIVARAYHSHYGDRFFTEMVEQGVLLWMRRGDKADWFDVAAQGGPLYLDGTPEVNKLHYAAWKELRDRVKQAQELNDLAASQAE